MVLVKGYVGKGTWGRVRGEGYWGRVLGRRVCRLIISKIYLV